MNVLPKPGFGIGIQNQGLISVLVLELIFFTETKFFFSIFFQIFLMFPTSCEDISFYKHQNKPRPSKTLVIFVSGQFLSALKSDS